MDIIPEAGWNRLAGRLKGRTSLVIGKTDTGKTTLVRYLLQWLLDRKESVCLVDSDIGQSSLGPPGTISMKMFSDKNELEAFIPDGMTFVGTLNPSKAIRQIVSGTARMVNEARKTGVKTIIVDTTGLVGGRIGKALKLAKVKAVRPSDIVALEREDEIEHVLSALDELKGIGMHCLKASRFAARRSRARRMHYRDELYRSYFRNSQKTRLKIETLAFTFRGRTFDIKTSPLDAGTVVGLNKGNETLALGVYKGMTEDAVIVETPLKRARGITEIIAGDITLASKQT